MPETVPVTASTRTPAMELLGISVPIIAAPLGRGTTAAFLDAVRRTGSIGFIGLTHVPPGEVAALVDTVSAATDGRYGINFSLIADKREGLRRALGAGARIVSVWQDDPTDYVRIAKDAGAIVLWTVASAEEASRADSMGVDIVVAQGAESGGHVLGRTPTMANLPAVVDAARGVPVVAAGGIADGRGLAAALALGADAVWLGTRFVASREAELHHGYKERIVGAGSDETVETTLYDVGWPDSPHRVLRTPTYDAWLSAGRPATGSRPGEGDIVGRQADGTAVPRYHIQSPAIGFEGDWSGMALYAGTSSQLVRGIPPVATIVATMMRDAEAAAARLRRICTGSHDDLAARGSPE